MDGDSYMAMRRNFISCRRHGYAYSMFDLGTARQKLEILFAEGSAISANMFGMSDCLSLGKEFDEMTAFLAEYRWMFDFKLTHIFQDCVFYHMPEEWKETLRCLSGEQLTWLPFGHIQPTWPESLKHFIKRCMDFTLPREVNMSYTEQYQVQKGSVPALGPNAANSVGKMQPLLNEATNSNERRETTQVTDGFTRFSPLDVSELNIDIKKGMSAKKIHEVCHMTSLIDHVTRVAGNNGVVDVGSGLGYLGQVLHSHYGHSVLGLEGKQGHTTGADKRLNKFACAGHLHNVTCELYQDPRSQQEFMFLVKDWFFKLKGSRCSHQKTGSKTLPLTGSSRIQAKAENVQIDAHWKSSSESENKSSSSEQTGTLNTATNSLTGFMLSASEQTGTVNTARKCMIGSRLSTSEQIGTVRTATNSMTCSRLSTSEQTGTLASEQTGTLASEQTGTLNTATNSTTGSSLFECFSPDSKTQSSVQLSSDVSKTQDFRSKLDSKQITDECSEMQENHDTDRNVGKSTEKSKKNEFCSSLESPKLCMVGLHCCGDLTPTVLKYFVELDAVTSLCCVSCCYHRMNYSEGNHAHENFPMSKLLVESLLKTRRRYPDFKLSLYSLRLAAQETRARWREQTADDHEFHMKNVAYRGVLETCLQKAGQRFEMKKCVRRLAHRDDYVSFSKYVDAVFKHIQTPQTEDKFRELFRSEMQKSYDVHHPYFCMIEPLTALQYLLQPVIESLIYRDRKLWLKEQGYHADIVPVFDELISPRNLALVAYKYNNE